MEDSMSNDTQAQGTSLALHQTEFALKVGKTTRNIATETALAIGHKDAMLHIQNAAFQAAFNGAKHGRYRAAAEIMGFAATAAHVKTVRPEVGDWNKARLEMLAELILGRAAPEKGWSKKAAIGRLMAQLVKDLIEGKPVPPKDAPTGVPSETKGETPAPAGTEPAPF